MAKLDKSRGSMRKYIPFTLVMLAVLAVVIFFIPKKEAVVVEKITSEVSEADKVENGIHVRTGLIAKDGYELVVANCTVCHSAKLVMQNRMNEVRWNSTIKWMQETQNLWDLGDNQKIIVDYLVKNYPIEKVGRRHALNNINWYNLK